MQQNTKFRASENVKMAISIFWNHQNWFHLKSEWKTNIDISTLCLDLGYCSNLSQESAVCLQSESSWGSTNNIGGAHGAQFGQSVQSHFRNTIIVYKCGSNYQQVENLVTLKPNVTFSWEPSENQFKKLNQRKNQFFIPLCSRNFQNVKLRLDFVEI